MIIEFGDERGTSFKGLATYLTHDPDKAKTNERVAWTHTLNLASDHPSVAVNEMLWTYRGADYLKREAGIKPGGRKLGPPVEHFSMNWHPTEKPSQKHMIESVEAFLKHLGWSEHQALLVAHIDKPHAHVHVMLNIVHPETGKAINAGRNFDHVSGWAKNYELEQGRVFCEQRLKAYGDRQRAPTRKAWMRMKESQYAFERHEIDRVAKDHEKPTQDDTGKSENDKLFKALKERQRQEREQFFIDGKPIFRAKRDEIFRDVRREFRPEWSAYYRLKRDGGDAQLLSAMKAKIIEDQKAMLDEWRERAVAELKVQRDGEYKQLRAEQQKTLDKLTREVKEGRRPYEVLDSIYPAARQEKPKAAAKELDPKTAPHTERLFAHNKESFGGKEADGEREDAFTLDDGKQRENVGHPSPANENFGVKGGLDGVSGIGLGALGAIAKAGERLMDGFFGIDKSGKTPSPPKASAPPKRPMTDEERERARRAAEVKAESERQEAEAAALVADWEYRRQRRRQRDRD
jgi:hypothetical protein